MILNIYSNLFQKISAFTPNFIFNYRKITNNNPDLYWKNSKELLIIVFNY
jgi:hypothetical protein